MTPPEPETISTTPPPCAPACIVIPPIASLATMETAAGLAWVLSNSTTASSDLSVMSPLLPSTVKPPMLTSTVMPLRSSVALMWMASPDSLREVSTREFSVESRVISLPMVLRSMLPSDFMYTPPRLLPAWTYTAS